METFDIAVIGAGPGGYPAAIRAAQLGAKTAIIEREQLGGTCLNWGCIPTKTLVAAAGVFASLPDAEKIGVKAGKATVDFSAMMAHKGKVVTQLKDGVGQLLKANGVTVFTGTASFESRNKIRIARTDAQSKPTTISAAKTIIATGSTSIMPSFLPKSKAIVESRGFLEMDKLPGELIVLGGGYIGCELACMAAQLGVKVTVVELLEDILLLLDRDLRAEVRAGMEKLGIKIMTGKAMSGVEMKGSKVNCKVGDETVSGDCLLVSVGRRPVTDGLELDKAGLKTNDKGFIEVDECGRTAAASIYAIGDVTGRIQLAHAATSHGLIAAGDACGRPAGKFERITPAVIFTTPEVATVGITEQEAAAAGQTVKTGKFTFRGLGRAVAAGHTEGFAKWIADENGERLLGAAIVGAHATDLIAEAGLAIRNELTVNEIGRTIHAHPTFAEVWMEAAHAVHGEAIHAAPRKKKA